MSLVRQYLSEIVNYGGIRMPRGEMIQQLTATAKQTDPIHWQQLVNTYLAGHASNTRVKQS